MGLRWTALCPFHSRSRPSFSVNAEEGLYYCFGCEANGDVITFVRELEHLDFVEAVEQLADRAGVTLHYDDEATGRDHQRLPGSTTPWPRPWPSTTHQLLAGPESAAARHYLRHERGYDSEVVRRFSSVGRPKAGTASCAP